MKSFNEINIPHQVKLNLKNLGYLKPTPIQKQAIPHALNANDILGIAQTGTGKTAAFCLPLIAGLNENQKRIKSTTTRCLILTPTRELATQISDEITKYTKGLKLKHAVIFGGVGKTPQIQKLRLGLDILVATPGRLLDLQKMGALSLENVEYFVLDEADRMLDMGFIHDIKRVLKSLPEKRQSMFFSATMPAKIDELAQSILTKPKKVEVTPQATTVEKIEQSIMYVAKPYKVSLLKDIVEKEDIQSALVFARTKHGANRVVGQLSKLKISSAVIHGNKSQTARQTALADFKQGKVKVLVATDIAARGIDIPSVTHVINFELPNDPESYVHRIGRTARAGRDGIAIAFCDPSEKRLLKNIEKTINEKIPVNKDHAYHDLEAPQDKKSVSARASKKQTQKENEGEKKKTHSHKHFFRKKKNKPKFR
jgi:ATP-dependent RNA helicase RhlE